MFIPCLPDPRDYAHDTPKNSLVLAFRAWQDSAAAERDQAAAHARFLIEQALASGDDKLIGIALSLMPSASAYRTFWSWVQQASWQHPQARCWPFVLPVVIVAANAQPVTIPGQLADVSALRELWARHQVFAEDADIWLCNRLIHAAALQDIRPTMVFDWSRSTQAAHAGWPQLPPAAALVNVQQEAAYLRFIPGLLKAPTPPLWPRSPSGWGREAAQWLSGLLGASGATALALPRAPQPLLAALDDGRRAQQEIAAQLFLGNAIRQFREQGTQPAAILAVHDNHELRVCLDDGTRSQVYSRHLEALDDVAAIEQDLCQFLHECQLATVQVIPTVQPDKLGGQRHVCGLDALAGGA